MVPSPHFEVAATGIVPQSWLRSCWRAVEVHRVHHVSDVWMLHCARHLNTLRPKRCQEACPAQCVPPSIWMTAVGKLQLDRGAVPYRAFCSDETLHVWPGSRVSAMSLTLCVLLWAQPGAGDALIAYEDRVLDLVSGHGGRVLQRARSNGADGQPLEIQLLEFPSTGGTQRLHDRRPAAVSLR